MILNEIFFLLSPREWNGVERDTLSLTQQQYNCAPVVVYSIDRQQGERFVNFLNQGHLPDNLGCKLMISLDSSLGKQPVSVFIVVLPDAEDSCDSHLFPSVLDWIPSFKKTHPSGQLLLLTGFRLSLQQSCQMITSGISAIIDYTQDDFPVRIIEQVKAAFNHYRELQLQQYGISNFQEYEPHGLVGRSKSLQKVLFHARRAACISDAPVIIVGESGTGKQRIAEYIHRMDEKRNRKPFVSVNCAAITGSLAESEMFGHKKGAFTGATDDRLGYFRAANGGSILLDEISEFPLSLQPKILRVLQEGLVLPVGSDKELRIDVRIIAATNRNLEKMVREHTFRLDLYQRLKVIQLILPSLRERAEDIPLLFEYFLEKYAHYYPGKIERVDPDIYQVIHKAIGPGNIRELENIVRQILAFKQTGNQIEISDLPAELIHSSIAQPNEDMAIRVPERTIEDMAMGSKKLTEVLDAYEQFLLARLIEKNINQKDLAERLGITRRTLYNKLQKYNLRFGKF